MPWWTAFWTSSSGEVECEIRFKSLSKYGGRKAFTGSRNTARSYAGRDVVWGRTQWTIGRLEDSVGRALSTSDEIWRAVGTGTGFLQPHSTHSTQPSPCDIPSQPFPLGLCLRFGPGLVMADTEAIYSTRGQMSGRASFHDARPPRGWLPLCWVCTHPLGVHLLSITSGILLPCGPPGVASGLLLGENS